MKPKPPTTPFQHVTVRCAGCGQDVSPADVRRMAGGWWCKHCTPPDTPRTAKQKNPKARRERRAVKRRKRQPIQYQPELCPTPSKIAYNTRRKADTALDDILKVPGRSWYPLRSYRCRCGKFHHTTQSS